MTLQFLTKSVKQPFGHLVPFGLQIHCCHDVSGQIRNTISNSCKSCFASIRSGLANHASACSDGAGTVNIQARNLPGGFAYEFCSSVAALNWCQKLHGLIMQSWCCITVANDFWCDTLISSSLPFFFLFSPPSLDTHFPHHSLPWSFYVSWLVLFTNCMACHLSYACSHYKRATHKGEGGKRFGSHPFEFCIHHQLSTSCCADNNIL